MSTIDDLLNLEVRNGEGKLNNIRKMQALKIGQFNQMWQMLEEERLCKRQTIIGKVRMLLKIF